MILMNSSTGSTTSASKLLAVLIILAVSLAAPLTAESSSYGKELYRSFSRKLGRNRTDYPALSDAEFANFRMVSTSGIGAGRLYRSSSPVSTWGNRNVIADNLAKNAGIKTFINLADSDSSVREQEGFAGSYYSTQNIIALGLGMKYQSKTFRDSLARGVKLMARSEPPYLIHCSLGKDRAGFVVALVECLAGASLQEVVSDYLVSFRNYFGVLPGTRAYDFVAENEITAFLARDFHVKSEELGRINLADAAERYFLGIGVSSAEIEALREKLKP